MSGASLVDWGLAERVATTIAGSSSDFAGGAERPFGPEAVAATCATAAVKVAKFTGLDALDSVPRGEAVSRAEWSRAGIATLRDLSSGLEAKLAEGISLPGPLGSIMRGLAGRAAGAEAGAAVGFGSRRVLGQFDISLSDSPGEPRLLLVEPNLIDTHRALGGPADAFLEWVALHETTHALQFGAVAWLRPHLADLLQQLIELSSAGLDGARLRELGRKLVSSDPRQTVRSMLRGELARALISPGQTDLFDRMQASMAVVEGYAEHVMDLAAPERAEEFGALRKRVDARRESRGGLGEVVARLLGLEMKLRQYKLGKTFCDAVAAEGGIAALNEVWASPEALPTPAELEAPDTWLVRMRTAAVA